MYLQTYGSITHFIPEQDSWPNVEYDFIFPPHEKRMSNKSILARRRAIDANSMPIAYSIKCGKCMPFGYNQRTCEQYPRTNTNIHDEVNCFVMFLFFFFLFLCNHSWFFYFNDKE